MCDSSENGALHYHENNDVIMIIMKYDVVAGCLRFTLNIPQYRLISVQVCVF